MADTDLKNVPSSQFDMARLREALTGRLDAIEAKIRPPSSIPGIYNVTMTTADTEYVQALPDGTKKFTIKCRDGTPYRLAYETGKVATPTAPYTTVAANTTKWEDNLDLKGVTIYVACGTAAKVVTIEAWR